MSGILKNSDDSDGRGIRITEYDVIMLRKKRIDSWQNWQEMYQPFIIDFFFALKVMAADHCVS